MVSRSSADGEYHSMAILTIEIKWLCSLTSYLGVTSSYPVKFNCDSKSAIYIA